MDLPLFLSVFGFCLSTTLTPGPNNILIFSSSAQHGVRAALPAYLGIVTGFPVMVLVISLVSVSLGAEVLERLQFIRYAGGAYLLYLAYRIYTAKGTRETWLAAPLRWIEMFAFQWINPKAWTMALSSVALVGPEYYLLPAAVFLLVAFPACGFWLYCGRVARTKVIGTPFERTMNRTLAALLALSVVLMLWT